MSDDELRPGDLGGLFASEDLAATPPHSREPAPGVRMPAALPRVGQTFAGYALEAELGRGGNGAVFRAARPGEPPRALKVLTLDLGDPKRAERFRREAAVGEALRHPGVIRVVGHGVERGLAYLVLELLEDALPLDAFARRRDLDALARARLIQRVAEAVQAAHAAGLVHRDLKPDNVLVLPGGEPKVIDFGLARHLERERLTQSGVLLGTLPYMAPEQVRGEGAHADARTDVYALGAILYELLADRRPFVAETLPGLIRQIADEPAPPLPRTLPAGLAEVVLSALAKDPVERPQSAAALALALAAITSAAPARRQLPLTPLLIGLGLVLAAGLGIATQLGRAVAPAAAELDARAREIAAETAPLASSAEAIEALGAGLEVARGPGGQEAKALQRLWRWSRERQRGLGSAPVGSAVNLAQDSPLHVALRGALEAVQGDPGRALALLKRAAEQGVRCADLLVWQAEARARLDLRAEGRRILRELERFELAQQAPLPPGLRELRARTRVALGELAAAEQDLASLSEPPASLLRSLGLAWVARELPRDPGAAARRLERLAAPESAEPAAELAREAERLLGPLAQRLARRELERSAEGTLRDLLRARRLLAPTTPLPDALLAPLLEGATGYVSATGLPEAARELALLYPDSRAVQEAVGKLAARQRHPQRVRSLLFALRAAARLSEAAPARARLQGILCVTLAKVNDDPRTPPAPAECDEAIALARELLRTVRDPLERAELHCARSRARRVSGASGALEDMDRALELNPGLHEYRLYRGLALAALGQREPALADLRVFAERAEDGSTRHLHAVVAVWEQACALERPLSALASLARLLAQNREAYPGWALRLAWLRSLAGEREEARASARDALRRLDLHERSELADLRERFLRASEGEGLGELVEQLERRRDGSGLP